MKDADISSVFLNETRNRMVQVTGGVPIVTSFSVQGRVEEPTLSTFKVVSGGCQVVLDLSKASFVLGSSGVWTITLPDILGGLSVELLPN